MRLKLALLFYFSSFCLLAIGQKQIEGIVFSKENEEELIGVNILIKGTENGTITNFEGQFSLSVESLPVNIELSYVGFKTKEVVIDTTSVVNIYLEEALDLTICYLLPEPPIIYGERINLTSPAPQMNLRFEDINSNNGTSIRPALNRVSGLFMHSGALNTNRITIRGVGNRSPFSTTKIKAYLDEIPLSNGTGETTIEDIDPSLLNNITVWKGPTASTYGAGLGGMIHLKTKVSRERPIGYLSSGVNMGSFGLLKNVNRFYYKDEKYSVSLNHNLLSQDGYRDNNEYDRQAIAFLGKMRFNKHSITMFVNHIDLKAFIPSSLNRDDYENTPTKAAFTWGSIQGYEDYQKTLFGLSNTFSIHSNLINKTSIFANLKNEYESRPFNILANETSALGGRTVFDWKKYSGSQGLSLSAGMEYFHETYDWQIYETNSGVQGELENDDLEYRKYYNLFFEGKYSFSKLFITTGINVNQTNYELIDKDGIGMDQSGDHPFETIWSPRIGLGIKINPHINLYSNISHGFSPPSLEETLTPEGIINPDLQPEQGWNFELGSRGSFIFGRLRYELSLYSMHIKDLLVSERITEDQFIGKNAGRTEHNGIEFSVNYKLTKSLFQVDFYSSYTYSDFRFTSFIDDTDDYSGNKLTGTAPHLLNFGIQFDSKFIGYEDNPLKGFYGDLQFQYVDAMPLRDDNSIYSDAYGILNLKLGYRRPLMSKKLYLDFSAGINNIFDTKYASMLLINAGSFGGNAPRYYYPGLPIHFYAGFNIKYIFKNAEELERNFHLLK